MKVVLGSIAGLLVLTGCTSWGKEMHTQRALEECREEVGNEDRSCEQSVKQERQKRDNEDALQQDLKKRIQNEK